MNSHWNSTKKFSSGLPDIPLDDVLQIHAALIERFGGSPGLRNLGILQSSLEQPHSEYFGHERYPTVIAKAAAYLYYVCQNHPFVDGNKRVAFALCSIYLNMHGLKLNMTVDEAENLTVAVASGSLSAEAVIEAITPHVALTNPS